MKKTCNGLFNSMNERQFDECFKRFVTDMANTKRINIDDFDKPFTRAEVENWFNVKNEKYINQYEISPNYCPECVARGVNHILAQHKKIMKFVKDNPLALIKKYDKYTRW
jgi:hypothetical protein